MPLPVNINDIIAEMEIRSDSHANYLNRETGEFVLIPREYFDVAETQDDFSGFQDWEREFIEAAVDVLESDKYIALPSKFEIHEYRIMEEFCLSLEDENVQNKLIRAIRGAGAFRRFKDNIQDFGIEKQWHRFKREAYKDLAIQWCKDYKIPYFES